MVKWTETHTELQNLMKQEIEAMRNLLGNMHQEEVFILQKNQHYVKELMEERLHLISTLSLIRQNREDATEKLASMVDLPHSNLEELLPPENENSWEIISLRDQIAALLDRINLQSSRNEMLVHLEAYQPAPQKKKKISIATLPTDDYNDVA
jgi:hypothetical protein